MDRFEYKVVPAPTKGQKARGIRRSEDKFAYSIEEVMNSMALDGWEYQRSETLPHEERTGLTSSSTTFRSVLVFRRAKVVAEPTPISEPTAPKIAPSAPLQQIEDHSPDLKDVTPAPELELDMVEEDSDVDEENAFFSSESFRAQKPDRSALPAALRRRATQKRSKRKIAAE
ncbi:DUF4177 domain-containing protein [Cognatishimia activa]|nr:DUF4177 domain-containing protein [Cognatishimia activa]